ncbi:serine hydrolase [Spongiimicrobium salis]|uniref:serine hydrolase n=1 Tax=Spongiimicrobium salis TaxID=1667022 RepID=UPI00374D1C03
MKLRTLFFTLLILISGHTYSQDLNSKKLNEFFNALEKRNEAMGSIAISKNGKHIYSRAIGHRTIKGKNTTPSNTATHFRAWSITKTYTAVMILQLIEEGKLSLHTTLDTYYPQIPNAEKITVELMLKHRSGLFDYVNDTDNPISLQGIADKDSVVAIISGLKPNFEPGEDFRYSNTNYLLLGYIIEILDEATYETSLFKRISSKLNLNSTYFGTNTISKLENIAETYHYDTNWKPVTGEANYNNHLATADGGIVTTPEDMTLFIDALFNERLVSKQSLNTMLQGEELYRLGVMKNQFENYEGYGHTGGWISESSLFYYPEHKLAIAYTTNGIVIRKEDILNNVLKIVHNKPFAVSMNRNLQALLVFGIGLLLCIVGKLKLKKFLNTAYPLYLGYSIALLYWAGTIISGFLYGNNYSHVRDGIPVLDTFYSNSGTFNASIQFTIALLSILFIYRLYKSSKRLNINFIPLLPLIFIPIYLIGSSLFPSPNVLYSFFANCIILSILSPLLAIVLWRNKSLLKIRRGAVISLFLMIVSICFIISRSSIPELVHTYWGIIQRLLFLGWTSWLVFLSFYFIEVSKLKLHAKSKLTNQ